MQKIVIICDKCGKEIKTDPVQAFELDFCPACTKAAKDLLANWIQQKEAQKPPDYGAAQALRDAGWKVKAIAAELGITENMVYDHTHAPRKKRKYALEFSTDQDPTKSPELV